MSIRIYIYFGGGEREREREREGAHCLLCVVPAVVQKGQQHSVPSGACSDVINESVGPMLKSHEDAACLKQSLRGFRQSQQQWLVAARARRE